MSHLKSSALIMTM